MKEESKLPSFEKKKDKPSLSSLVLKSLATLGLFFLIALSVYWMFGRVAFEHLDRSELFSQVIQGHSDSRRSSSLEWVSILQKAESEDDLDVLRKYLPTPGQSLALVKELNSIQVSSRPDPETVSGILGILGFSYSSAAQDAMVEFLRKNHTDPSYERASLFAVLGLGRRSPDSILVLDLYRDILDKGLGESDLLKTIAYVVGFHGEGELSSEEWSLKQALLNELLTNTNKDVRLNAALSTMRLEMNSEPAEKVILDLLRALSLDLQKSLTEERKSDLVTRRDAYLASIKITSSFESEEAQAILVEISKAHPDLKIRQAAMNAVAER